MDDFFNTDVRFDSFGLSDDLLKGIKELGFEHPTKVQAAIIPHALEGKDVIAQSKTGTGKTVAFGLPLLQMIDRQESLAAIILVPTRELAIQVSDELRNLSQFSPMKVLAIYGGQKISIQTEHLKRNPNIIVGTPGRVMDMHGRGLLPYDSMRFAVLDEVDEMLDIGFRDDIRKILGSMSHKRQTIFVSATISPEIERLARQYMKKPEKLIVSQGKSLTVSQVQQSYFSVEPWDKKRLLLHLLRHEEPALTLTFCRTKQTVDALAEYLIRKGIEAHAIHGDMYQGKRTRIMKQFKSGQLGVLVASDLAARGLDVKGITHVINYDLPEDPEIYVHRIGRTARVGRDGFAWSFATPEQGHLLSNIERLTNVEIPLNKYEDFEPGPLPAAVIAKRELDDQREAERTADNSRIRSAPPAPDEAVDTSKFPGGKVPAALPARRMGGRVRTRRR